jgi:hypothetical protein
MDFWNALKANTGLLFSLIKQASFKSNGYFLKEKAMIVSNHRTKVCHLRLWDLELSRHVCERNLKKLRAAMASASFLLLTFLLAGSLMGLLIFFKVYFSFFSDTPNWYM